MEIKGAENEGRCLTRLALGVNLAAEYFGIVLLM